MLRARLRQILWRVAVTVVYAAGAAVGAPAGVVFTVWFLGLFGYGSGDWPEWGIVPLVMGALAGAVVFGFVFVWSLVAPFGELERSARPER
jgi:hypothetical protein